MAGSVKTEEEEEMKKKREKEEKKKGEMAVAVAHGCRGKWRCHSLVGCLDDQT